MNTCSEDSKDMGEIHPAIESTDSMTSERLEWMQNFRHRLDDHASREIDSIRQRHDHQVSILDACDAAGVFTKIADHNSDPNGDFIVSESQSFSLNIKNHHYGWLLS